MAEPSTLIRPAAAARPNTRRLLAISIAGRLAHDVSVRLVYPFMPEIAAGLKIGVDQLGALLSLRNGISIVGPLFGAWADRVGHRRAMIVGLLLVAIGMGLIGLSVGLIAPALGLIIAGAGSALYLPALLAYASERTPYRSRGRVLGAIELAWALSGMIGVPVMGLLIAPLGWRAPFVGLAVAAVSAAALTLILEEAPRDGTARPHFNLGTVLRNRSALAFIAAWFLVFFAFEAMQVSYGSWLESRFGLDAAGRGSVQTLFGLFEIAASGGSTAFLDRLGKKRGVTGGLIVVVAGYLLLATLGQTALPWALASISLAFLGFEFSVVSGVSVMSELVPEARGTMLAFGASAGSVGRMAADIAGSAVMASVGFAAVALIAIAAGVLTVLVFALGVKERRSDGVTGLQGEAFSGE